jgi:hypothetical protein
MFWSPAALIRALTRYGQRQADLTAAFLRNPGLFGSTDVRLPTAVLVELSAVLQLGLWESTGLRCHLDSDLPFFNDAVRDLAIRCRRGPAEFDGVILPPLALRVLRVWLRHFAWEAPDVLGRDIVVSDFDDDQLIDLLAEFIWQHRDSLATLVLEVTRDEET